MSRPGEYGEQGNEWWWPWLGHFAQTSDIADAEPSPAPRLEGISADGGEWGTTNDMHGESGSNRGEQEEVMGVGVGSEECIGRRH